MLSARIYFTKIFGVFAIALLGLLFVSLAFTHEADAATGIRRTINFQGKLVDKVNGTNVANGSYSVVFSIYDVGSGGTALWSETQGSVSVTDGVFQVELGSSTAFPSDFNFNWDGRYLGVNVASDGEMTPRIRLTAAPYAFNAEKVAGLTVQDDAGNASTSAILRLANGKTVTVSNSLTFTGTDSTSFAFPSSGGNVVTESFTQSLTNKTIGSTGLTFSAATTDITTVSNEDLTLSVNGSGNFVFSGDFDSGITLGTAISNEFPLLIRSGIGSNAALVVDQLNSGDLFSASASGTTKFTIDSTGTITTGIWGGTALTDASVSDTLTSSLFVGSGSTTTAIDLATAEVGGVLPIANGGSNKNLTLSNGGIVWTDADSLEVLTAAGGAGSCLLSGGAATPSWGSCAAGGGSNWDITAGAITPKLTSTLDLLLGSQATISAKFGFLNVNSGTPTASISANANSNATYLAGSGSLQSVRNNTLTLGGDTTGNIAISPNNGGAGSLLTVNAINQTWSGTTTLTASSLATLTSAATLGVSATTLTLGGNSAATLSTVTDDNLTLTANGTGDLRILSDTDTDILFPEAAFITEDNSLLYTGAAGKLFALTSTTAGQCVVSAAANNAPTWATCPGGAGGSSNWTLSTINGTISPNNGTVDLVLGFGTSAASTASAKFSVTNLAGALSPTASLSATTESGGNGNGLVFSTSGNNATIQALRNNTLTIGGGTTGNIVLRSGEGIVFIGENEVKSGGLTFYSSGAGIADPTITVDASGNLTIQATQTGASVIVGDGSGNISLSLTAAADGLIADKTVTLAGTYTGDDFTFKRIFTGGANIQSGSILKIHDTSGGTGTINGDLLLVNSALTSGNFTGNLGAFQQNGVAKLSIQGSGTSPVVKITGLTSSAGLIVDNAGVGDLITASASGATKFTLSNSGSASMSGSITLDSAASIQTTKNQTLTIGGSTTGTVFLQSNNSSTGRVQVGTGNGGTTTPDLFGLDVKSDTGDPTGFEGAMYYNTNTNKFRCYQGSAWTDCITAGASTKYLVNAHTLASTTATEVTEISTALTAGTYVYKYSLRVQSSATGTGLGFGINYTGTATSLVATAYWLGTGTAASTGVLDDSTEDLGPAAEQIIEGGTFNTESTTNPNMDVMAGVAAANQDAYVTIEGVIVVSDIGDIELWHNSETAANTSVMPGSSLVITQITAGADLAEIYSTKDESIVPGDVVSLDSSLKAGVKKSTKPYDSNIFGIISTSPSLVMGSVDDKGAHPALVAMSGRVPVKVTTENGPIKFGDLLTSSSTPGVAMKATKAGQVIGQAMSEYSGQGVGKVMVFVKTDYSMGDINSVTSFTDLITKKNLINTENLSGIYTDKIAAGLEIITPKLTAQEINVESLIAKDIQVVDASISGVLTADIIRANKIEGLEFAVRDQVLSMRDLLKTNEVSGEVSEKSENTGLIAQARNLFSGFVEFLGKVIFRDNVEFEGQVAFNSDTAGYAKILKGQKFVDIIFDKEYENQPVINVSPTVEKLTEEEFARLIEKEFCIELEGIEVCQDKITDLLLSDEIKYVVQDENTKGFRIFINDFAPIDVKFSWKATAVKNVKTISNNGPVGLVLPFEGEYTPSNKFGEHSEDPKIKDKDLRLGLKGHDGLDIAISMGTPVLAADDGEVELDNNDYGTTIYIKHSWGKTVYGHLSERLVEGGDKVTKGQKIALSGNSGLSTGPHLHFGISLTKSKTDNGYNGYANPMHYLSFSEPEITKAVAGTAISPTPMPSKAPAPTVKPTAVPKNDDLISLPGLIVN